MKRTSRARKTLLLCLTAIAVLLAALAVLSWHNSMNSLVKRRSSPGDTQVYIRLVEEGGVGATDTVLLEGFVAPEDFFAVMDDHSYWKLLGKSPASLTHPISREWNLDIQIEDEYHPCCLYEGSPYLIFDHRECYLIGGDGLFQALFDLPMLPNA